MLRQRVPAHLQVPLVPRNVSRGDALTPLLAQRLLVLLVLPLRCLLLGEHVEHVLLRRKGLQALLFGHALFMFPGGGFWMGGWASGPAPIKVVGAREGHDVVLKAHLRDCA